MNINNQIKYWSIAVVIALQCFTVAFASQLPLPSPFAGNVKYSKLKAVPLPPSPPSTVFDGASKIGVRFKVGIVVFSPTYPVDKDKLADAWRSTNLKQALDLFAAGVDGHVEHVMGSLYVISPNFRVDAAAGSLLPQARAAVRSVNSLAWILGDVPPELRPAAIAPSSLAFSRLSAPQTADIDLLTFNGKSLASFLFDGQILASRSISIHPELMVSIRYGTFTLASYDEYAQYATPSGDIRWDMFNALETARKTWSDSKSSDPTPAASDPITFDDASVEISRNKITVSELAKIAQASGADLIIDHEAAGMTTALTPGKYKCDLLIDAMTRALRLRILRVADPTAKRPLYVMTVLGKNDDQELVHELVDRQIAVAWQPLLQTIRAAHTIPLPSLWPLEEFETFTTLPYNSLDDAQLSVVNRALSLLPEQLSDSEKSRINVTLRPAILADCRVNSSLTASLEQIAYLYADAK